MSRIPHDSNYVQIQYGTTDYVTTSDYHIRGDSVICVSGAHLHDGTIEYSMAPLATTSRPTTSRVSGAVRPDRHDVRVLDQDPGRSTTACTPWASRRQAVTTRVDAPHPERHTVAVADSDKSWMATWAKGGNVGHAVEICTTLSFPPGKSSRGSSSSPAQVFAPGPRCGR